MGCGRLGFEFVLSGNLESYRKRMLQSSTSVMCKIRKGYPSFELHGAQHSRNLQQLELPGISTTKSLEVTAF